MSHRGRWISAGLIALAIVARASAVLLLQSHTIERSTYEHGEIAANLLAGKGFSVKFLGADGPTSQQAPLYPFVVAGAYALGGVGTPRSLLILELGQAALGGVLVAMVMAMSRVAMPERPRAAWLAGGLVAIHPTLVYAATHVQVASIAVVLLAAAFWAAYRTGAFGLRRDAILAGFLLGLTALTDPILALSAPGIAWVISRVALVACPPVRQESGRPFVPSLLVPRTGGQATSATRIGLIALVGATAALTVSPWIVRNYRVHGELVWIKSSFGYAFWQGNCALSEGTDKVVRASVERRLAASGSGWKDWNRSLWAARHDAGYLDDIALTADDYRELSALREPERSRRLAGRALDDLAAEPGRYAQLCLRRLRYFVLWDDTNPKARSLIYRASHLGLTILALAGWLAMGAAGRKKWAPTALTAALIALFHTLTIVSARFHLPIEPFLALWAAGGLARLGEISLPAGRCDAKGGQLSLRLPRVSLAIESSSDRI
ncbi:MAG: hypothetical protein U0800_24645 [Isosphaeraceae bacterium]